MIALGILGAKGRMGREVSSVLEKDYATRATCIAAADRGDDLSSLLDSQVVIDFSSPAAVLELVKLAENGAPRLPALVLGSTGWKIDERNRLLELSKRTPVLMTSNFSTGVLAFTHILKQAAPLLEKLGYTPVIVEGHHRHKKDAPSGTALSLQRAIAPAGPGNVQTHSIRAGEIVGDHEVTYYGTGDRISFKHEAQDRSIFARGAIDVALWLATKAPTGALQTMDAYFQEVLAK